MRKLLMLVAGMLVLTTSALAQKAQPNSYQTRDLSLGSFDRLEVTGPFKVLAVAGETPQVSISGPPALLADTIAEVRGNALTLRFREGASWSWNPGSGVNVVVSAPRLVSVEVQGPAQVEVSGVSGDNFSAATGGSGTIVLRGLDGERVRLATSGSGGIRAEGTAHEGTYTTAGSGSIDAKRLRVESASIAIGGAGSIYADVSGTANVAVSGSGKADVVGGANCNTHTSDSAKVECR